jgi:hypothetical protein
MRLLPLLALASLSLAAPSRSGYRTSNYNAESWDKYAEVDSTAQPPSQQSAPRSDVKYAAIPEWFKKSNVGFAFAGSAALLPYYLGVAYALVDSSAIIRGVTPIGGLSGGAITGSLIHSMLDFDTLYTAISDIVKACNDQNPARPCMQAVYPTLLTQFAKLFPDDIHTKTINKNILRVVVTLVDERAPGMNVSRPMVISRVRSKEAMLRSLGATSYIPCFSGPYPYTLFEGLPVIDGGYSAKYEHLCPEGTEICIKIGSYYIGPHTLNFAGDSDRECVANEMNPGAWPVRAVSNPWRSAADLSPTAQMEKWNPNNVTVPFTKYGFLPQTCASPQEGFGNPGVGDIPFAKPGQANIFPGKYPQNPIPYTCKQWQDLSFKPTEQDFVNMVKLGLQDVALWLEELSFVSGPGEGSAETTYSSSALF